MRYGGGSGQRLRTFYGQRQRRLEQHGSFGGTSPIFIDRLTPTGSLVNTLPVPANMIVTCFNSKPEMAIDFSPD
jgi:hypothetical protein